MNNVPSHLDTGDKIDNGTTAFDKLMALQARTGIRSLSQLLALSNAINSSASDADIETLIRRLN